MCTCMRHAAHGMCTCVNETTRHCKRASPRIGISLCHSSLPRSAGGCPLLGRGRSTSVDAAACADLPEIGSGMPRRLRPRKTPLRRSTALRLLAPIGVRGWIPHGQGRAPQDLRQWGATGRIELKLSHGSQLGHCLPGATGNLSASSELLRPGGTTAPVHEQRTAFCALGLRHKATSTSKP